MLKTYGASAAQDGVRKIGKKKWEICFGFFKDNDSDTTGYNYRQRFDHCPTAEEAKAVILEQLTQHFAEAMTRGFLWNGLRVEYTEERKGDFTGLLTRERVPITMNLGPDKNGNPQFFNFTTLEQLQQVSDGFIDHRIAICSAEWQAKAALAESDAFNQVTP